MKPCLPLWIRHVNAAAASVLLLGTFRCGIAQDRPDIIWMRGGLSGRPDSIVYSPDGKYFASSDDTFKLWRVSDGMLLRTLGSGPAIAFSADSKRLLGASAASVIVYSVPDGKAIRTISNLSAVALSLAVSPLGQEFAVGLANGIVQQRRLADGALIRSFAAQTDRVFSVAYSGDGELLATASGSRTSNVVDVWNAASGTHIRTFTGTPNLAKYDVKFSQDGKRLYHLDFPYVKVWRVADGVLLGTLNTDVSEAVSFAVAPDGLTVAAVGAPPGIGGNGYVYLFDAATLSRIGTNRDFFYLSRSLTYSPDSRVITGGALNSLGGGIIQSWRNPDLTPVGTVTPPRPNGRMSTLAVSPNGQWLATGTTFHGNILIRRTSDGAVVSSIPVETVDRTTAADFSSDSSVLATAAGGKFQLWAVPSGTLLKTINSPDGLAFGVHYSKDGKYFAATGSQTLIYRLSDWAVIQTLPGSGGFYSRSTFSPDSAKCAVIVLNEISLYRIADGAFVQGFRNRGNVTSIAFSPDGSQLLASEFGDEEGANVFSVATGALLHHMTIFDTATYAAFASDGQAIALSSTDGHLYFYEAIGGTLLSRYSLETENIYSLGYSRDDKYLYCGRGDGTAYAILNPYRNAVFPTHGGNIGTVTVRIVTPEILPITDGTTVTLHDGIHPDISVTANRVNDHVLTVTFNLHGAPLGKRDVVIDVPGVGTRTYPQGFTVEEGVEAAFATEIIGRTIIRAGASSTYNYTITNLSGNDASATLWIAFPKSMSWSFGTHESLRDWSETDDEVIIPYDLSVIPAHSSFGMPMLLSVPDDPAFAHHEFILRAWVTHRPRP